MMLEEVKGFCDTHHDSETPHPCSKPCCAMKAPLACPALIQFRPQRVQRLEEFAQAGLKTGHTHPLFLFPAVAHRSVLGSCCDLPTH